MTQRLTSLITKDTVITRPRFSIRWNSPFLCSKVGEVTNANRSVSLAHDKYPFNRFQPKIMFIEPLSLKSQKRLSRRSPVSVRGDGA